MRHLLSTSLLLALLAACSDGGTEAGAAREPSVAPSSGTEPAATAPDPEAERAAKRDHREPGETEIAEIDWTDAASHPRTDPGALSAEAREGLAEVALPALLPQDPALLEGAVITHGPTWYAAALHPEGHDITIHGQRQVTHQPTLAADVPESERRRPGEPALSRTHGIVSVSFEAFGASYTLDVECAAPTTDTRCTEDAYALSVFESLGVAGGTP